jgi:hypothetical protein
MVRGTDLTKKLMKSLVLTTPISLNCNNLFVKQLFNKGLKFLKLLKDFRFVLE